jgi:hypothetical protein
MLISRFPQIANVAPIKMYCKKFLTLINNNYLLTNFQIMSNIFIPDKSHINYNRNIITIFFNNVNEEKLIIHVCPPVVNQAIMVCLMAYSG